MADDKPKKKRKKKRKKPTPVTGQDERRTVDVDADLLDQLLTDFIVMYAKLESVCIEPPCVCKSNEAHRGAAHLARIERRAYMADVIRRHYIQPQRIHVTAFDWQELRERFGLTGDPPAELSLFIEQGGSS